YVEIWCEKDALAGVIDPITDLCDVPLMPTRGYSSETFCFEAVEGQVGDPRPYFVYDLGDFDRSGDDAVRTLEEKLLRFADERGVDVEFVHLGIKAGDIVEFDAAAGRAHVIIKIGGFTLDRWLPTRDHKRKSPADKKWPFPFACELDAIE